VQNFGLGNFDTTLVDSEVLVEEAKGSTDVVIGEEGVETEVPDVKGKVQEANAKMEAAVAARKAASARIFSELKSGIPSSLTELTKTAASSTVKIAKIQAIADQLGPVAQDNPLMTKADMVNFRQDEQTLQSEIQSLSNLSTQIVSDSVDYSARIANALATMERMDKTAE